MPSREDGTTNTGRSRADANYDKLRPWLGNNVPDASGEVKGFCPVHEEPGTSNSPSAQFNLEKGVWYCHSADCGKTAGKTLPKLLAWMAWNGKASGDSPPAGEVYDSLFNPDPRLLPEEPSGRRSGDHRHDPRLRDDETVDMDGIVVAKATAPKLMPEEFESRVAYFLEQLIYLPGRMAYLTDERGLTEETIANAQIGWSAKRERYTFPIRDRFSRLLNIRYYSTDPAEVEAGRKWLNHTGYGGVDIYGDELLDDASFVVAVAGEFDALVGRQLLRAKAPKLAVVSFTGGEGNVPRDPSRLRGKAFATLYDADDGGRSGSTRVASKLATVVQRHVIGAWPNGVEKGFDLSDAVRAGWTAERVLALLKDAPEYEPTAADDPEVQAYAKRLRVQRAAKRLVDAEEAASVEFPDSRLTLAEELEIVEEDADYTIDELLPIGGNVLLAAKYKAGKTTLDLNAVRAMADGEAFLGAYGVRKLSGRVAYWNYELTDRQCRKWLREMEIRKLDRASVLHLRGYRLPLDLPGVEDWAVEWLKAREVEFWIVDPFSRAYSGEENSNSEVGRFLEALDVVKQRAGVKDLILTTHMGREKFEEGEERARGATRIDDWADVRWTLTLDKGRRFFGANGRDVDVPERGVQAEGRLLTIGEATRRDARKEAAIEAAINAVRAVPGIGKAALMKAMKGHAENAAEAIGEAIRLGLIRMVEKGQKQEHYPVEEA